LKKKAVWLGLAAVVVSAVALSIVDPNSTPDADTQEKTLTKCLHAAGLKVKSEIPPFTRFHRSPEYEVEVRDGDDLVGFIYLFDDPQYAESFVDRARQNAEDEGHKAAIRKRGPAAVELVSGARAAPAARGCIGKAAKPRASA
jgi:hypothetical protein